MVFIKTKKQRQSLKFIYVFGDVFIFWEKPGVWGCCLVYLLGYLLGKVLSKWLEVPSVSSEEMVEKTFWPWGLLLE